MAKNKKLILTNEEIRDLADTIEDFGSWAKHIARAQLAKVRAAGYLSPEQVEAKIKGSLLKDEDIAEIIHYSPNPEHLSIERRIAEEQIKEVLRVLGRGVSVD